MLGVRLFHYPKDQKRLRRLFETSKESDAKVIAAVKKILESTRRHGDRALCALTREFDGVDLKPSDLRLAPERLAQAWSELPKDLKKALRLALKRIETFHRRQARKSWTIKDPTGLNLSQRWSPLKRVGVYAPGGTAAYPSTVLMNIVPAKVAGVSEIVAVTPPAREGVNNHITLGALHLCKVSEVYQIGGAQAIAALAYGSKTIPRVDKVVGPGNAYVAAAKRLLYGLIDIDAIAGPSEVMILADSSASPSWVAADLLAQAEHDVNAQALAVLIGEAASESWISDLQKEIRRQTNAAPRAAIIRKSLRSRGALIAVEDRETAAELANLKAPEHLEIATRKPHLLARKVSNAGSIFIGHYTPEPLGDYIAGPNHVLPTGGTARFASALSVDDFMRMTQVIEATPKGLQALRDATVRLAEAEGLFAHAQTIRARFS